MVELPFCNLKSLADMNYQALVDVMVTHYKEKYERFERLMTALQNNYRVLREDNERLRRAYDVLEDWAIAQEQRANALHSVIDTFIDRNGENVRRDLMEAFNEVATDLDVNLDLDIDLMHSDDDFSIGEMGSDE